MLGYDGKLGVRTSNYDVHGGQLDTHATSNTCLVRKCAKIKLTKPNLHSYHTLEVLFKQEAFFKIIGIASSIKEERKKGVVTHNFI